MLPDKKVMCHHTGFKVSCFKNVTEHHCQKWMQIMGRNPQTGEDSNRYGCADSFMPLIMIENSQMQRQTSAAIESFRNSVMAVNRDLLPPASPQLIERK